MEGVCQLRHLRPCLLCDLCGVLSVLCDKDFDFAVTHARILNRKGREGFRKGRKGNQEVGDAFPLVRFQYRYPGTPISTIAAPQKASVGRVTMVFSVHAPPMMT